MTNILRALIELGPRSLAHYLVYRVELRSGWLRLLLPTYEWDDRPLSRWLQPDIPGDPEGYAAFRRNATARFFFDPQSDLRDALLSVGAHPQGEADAVLNGVFRLFGALQAPLGSPPRWDAFTLVGEVSGPCLAMSSHWTGYRVERHGADIKLLWEPSRFLWIYPLARAYRLSSESRYFQGFWALIESWRSANRPNAGPHWVSAQEVALRLLALVFGMYAFAPELQSAPERLADLAQMIAVHAARIPPTLTYALAQDNNHLLSEAVALYTVGAIFPEFRAASRWRALGRRHLLAGLSRQIFPDGGYVQHSLNYQRMALHLALWGACLAERNGEPFPAAVREALAKMTGCLAALVDAETGRAPNFGPNDGAHILPLGDSAFDDYRPTIQTASVAFLGRRAFPQGLWDEPQIWLGLATEGQASEGRLRPARIGSLRDDLPQAGLYVLRGQRARAVVRCVRFHSRPGHSDQGHVDFWWRGVNVATDAGTYMYNGAPPWDNALAGAGVHNTLVLHGEEPMRRAGRFLWLDWAQGRALGRWAAPGGQLEALAVAHDGYHRFAAAHRRTVARAGDDVWLVVDEVMGLTRGSKGPLVSTRRERDLPHAVAGDQLPGSPHVGVVVRLGWLMPDGPFVFEGDHLTLDTPAGPALLRVEAPSGRRALYKAGVRLSGDTEPDEDPVWGWRSPTYAQKEPALFFVLRCSGALPLRIISWWICGNGKAEELTVEWGEPGAGLAGLHSLAFRGDRLDIPDARTSDPPSLRHVE
ncbi:MAG TPA: alginate lyase family protein [Anaerolineales bacterium]|nr:alginate lyase family protein [Anaerolineales bacterium]